MSSAFDSEATPSLRLMFYILSRFLISSFVLIMLYGSKGPFVPSLGALPQLGQTAFAPFFKSFGIHTNIVAWDAMSRMGLIERVVAAFEDIHLRICEFRVAMYILLAIF
jgi:hypothetical protein